MPSTSPPLVTGRTWSRRSTVRTTFLEVSVAETVVLDEDGADRGVPELRLRTGADGITLTDRDQILQLQAIINRAVNQWRASASHLA